MIKAEVYSERWSGHGEGGTIAKISLSGLPTLSNPYVSTQDDYALRERTAKYINNALVAYAAKCGEFKP